MKDQERAKEEVLEKIAQFIQEIVGEEYAENLDITMETSLFDDLEMESIKMIEFVEKVKNHYGQKVDLVAVLSNMKLDDIVKLKIGDMVDYIVSCHS